MPQRFSVQTVIPPAFTKVEVALHQLSRAMRLFLDEGDSVSAITLAGAAEEILGRLLEQRGKIPALQAYIDLCMLVGQYPRGDRASEKEFATIANHFRNGLKHYTDGEDIEIPPEAAVEMIDRAISNVLQLGYPPDDLMLRFLESCHT